VGTSPTKVSFPAQVGHVTFAEAERDHLNRSCAIRASNGVAGTAPASECGESVTAVVPKCADRRDGKVDRLEFGTGDVSVK
jgi:hypothetical protein